MPLSLDGSLRTLVTMQVTIGVRWFFGRSCKSAPHDADLVRRSNLPRPERVRDGGFRQAHREVLVLFVRADGNNLRDARSRTRARGDPCADEGGAAFSGRRSRRRGSTDCSTRRASAPTAAAPLEGRRGRSLYEPLLGG